MNAMARNALTAYAEVGLETRVAQASPAQLIVLLYEGALAAILIAKGHMQRNEIGPKGAALSKAIAIIDDGLTLSLDLTAGGELAQNLRDLYQYMSHRLLIANLKNDVEGLDEVSRLLTELKSAWDEIARTASSPTVDTPPPEGLKASKSYGAA